MLFLTENGYLEVLSEPQFENVFTLQSTDPGVLKKFEPHTPASIMVNRRSKMPYVLHVRKEKVAEVLDCVSVLLEKNESAASPISARVPIYLVEGLDSEAKKQVKLLVKSLEFDEMKEQIESLEDVAFYPIYKPLTDIMEEGGLR